MNADISVMGVIESKYPVLVFSFNNCELHGCHLDGYKNNNVALLDRLALIDEYFENKSKVQRYRIWLNIDDSLLSSVTIERIIQSLVRIEDNIIKIAIIGAGNKKRHFEKILKKSGFRKPSCFFSDAEAAKEWLV